MPSGRKWDDPTPRRRAERLDAAKEAAALVNRRLVEEGVLAPANERTEMVLPLVAAPPRNGNNEEASPKVQTVPSEEAFSCEIEINSISPVPRNLLTATVTQDDIARSCNAKVETKGRYIGPDEEEAAKLAGERPLYLAIQGPTQYSVNAALQRISGILKTTSNVSLSSLIVEPSSSSKLKSLRTSVALAGVTPTLAFVQDKLFVGLEHAPPSFDVKSNILGPDDSFLQHIQAKTGARVMLRGRGSGYIEPMSGREAFEPMHIYIQHGNYVGLQEAKNLVQNLLETVKKKYTEIQENLASLPPAVNPGTASMLAGLHQPGFSSFNSNLNWMPVPPVDMHSGFSSVSPISGRLLPPPPVGVQPDATQFHPPQLRMPSGQFVHPSLNLSCYPTSPNVNAMTHQQPTLRNNLGQLPPFNGVPLPSNLTLFLPPPPPPSTVPAMSASQISSVSAAQNYYENYLPASYLEIGTERADREGLTHHSGKSSQPSRQDPSATNDSNRPPTTHRRRFQEKPEEEDSDKLLKNQSATPPATENSPPPSSSKNKDHNQQSSQSESLALPLSSNGNESNNGDDNDSDRRIMPPPPVLILKRKVQISDPPLVEENKLSTTDSQFKVPDNKKSLGALGSVMASYSSGYDDSSDDEDETTDRDERRVQIELKRQRFS